MGARQRHKTAGLMRTESPYLSKRSSAGAEQGFVVSRVGGHNTEQARAGTPSEILGTERADPWSAEGHEDRREATCSLLSFPSGTPGTPSPLQATPAGMAGPRGAIRRISWVGRVLREDFRARDTSMSKTSIPRQATESPGLYLASRGHCRPQHVKLPQAPVPLTSDLLFQGPCGPFVQYK